MSVPVVKDNAIVRTKRTWLFVAGLVYSVVAIAPLTLMVIRGVTVYYLSIAVYYGGALALLIAWDRWWREERGRIRGDETGLWLDDRRVVRREGLRHAYLLREKNRWSVHLGRRWRPVDVIVDGEPEGAALLAGMRLDPTRSVARFLLMFGTRRGAFIRAMASLVSLGLTGWAMLHFCGSWRHTRARSRSSCSSRACGSHGCSTPSISSCGCPLAPTACGCGASCPPRASFHFHG